MGERSTLNVAVQGKEGRRSTADSRKVLLSASYIQDMNNPSCKVSGGEEGEGWTILRRPIRTFLGDFHSNLACFQWN